MLTHKYARRIRHNPKMFKAARSIACQASFATIPAPGRSAINRYRVHFKLDTSAVI